MSLVSFLVPVYNVEEYLPKCLDSLLAQTWPEIEIVLVNDGSTDNSLKIAEEYQKKHPNIHIYSYENSGISKTRNRLLAHAGGDFVMFVDSDDFIDPQTVETMMKTQQEHDLDLVQCGFRMDYRYFTLYRPGSGHRIMDCNAALHMLSKGRCLNNYPWGKLTRRSCFDGVRFPEDFNGFEDTFTIFKSVANAKRIGTIPQRFYHYVQRRGSLTNRMSLDYVSLMRKAYHYQSDYLNHRFPGQNFSFDLQYYNTDMVLIYTIIVFSKRNEHVVFKKDDIDWKKIPASLILRIAYEAWLGIAKMKMGSYLQIEQSS